MTNLPLVLHIGYHKTGTTFLQNNIFSKHKDIFYLGQPFRNSNIANAIREFKFQHDLNFDSNVIRDKIYKEIKNYSDVLLNTKRLIMISLESLHSGEEWFGRNIVTMSYRLKDTFPDAKIILGIRSQAKYIVSNYKEYIIHGGKMCFDTFLFDSFLCNRCLFPKLCYDKVINHYKKLFHDNLYIYIHDKLLLDKKTEIQKLFNFLEIEENIEFDYSNVYKSLTKNSAELIRFINKFSTKDFIEQYYDVGVNDRFSALEKFRRRLIRIIRKLGLINVRIFESNSYLTNKHIEYIRNNFSESNKNLSDLLNNDIRKLGFWYDGSG